jgi:hypothetical protein
VSWSQSPSTRSVLSWILFCMPFQYVSPMIHSALGPHDPIPFSITMPAWLLEAFPENKKRWFQTLSCHPNPTLALPYTSSSLY